MKKILVINPKAGEWVKCPHMPEFNKWFKEKFNRCPLTGKKLEEINKTPNPVDLRPTFVSTTPPPNLFSIALEELKDAIEAVTRLEIIDSNGRSYVNLHANPMEFSYQDNGKTLKIFCGNKEDMSKPEPKIDIKEERVEPIKKQKLEKELEQY